MLCFLDYSNVEGYNYRFDPSTNNFVPWNNTFFNNTFSFDVTWKGRMFYLIFAWFLVIESAFGWKKLVDKKPTKKSIMAASLVCALVPTAYVLATNFLSLDLAVLKFGHSVGITSVTASGDPSDFLHLQWPLSLEYIVFFVFFLAAVLLAYRPKELKVLSISFAVLGAIGFVYMLDTIYPFGVFRPLQELALPTVATAAALFDILGYTVWLNYPMHSNNSSMPSLNVTVGDKSASYGIAWACAGVYSLILFVLIILLFFKRTNISGYRKVLYFFIGLIGTFFANVLRIYALFIVTLDYGHVKGMIFHNGWGELFGFGWIFFFILLIVCVERFMLVEKVRGHLQMISARLQGTKNNSLPNEKAAKEN
jgi:thaumarchaeosortase